MLQMMMHLIIPSLIACGEQRADRADATAIRHNAQTDAHAAPLDASDAASSRSDAGRPDSSRGGGDAGPPSTLLVGRHLLNVGELAWSPDGQTIATCELDSRWGPGQVKLWSAQTLNVVGQLGDINRNEASAGNTGWDTCSIDFSPDGQTLVESRYKLNYLRRWDLSSRAELEPFEAGGVMSVAYSPDGRSLAAVVYADRLMGAPGVTEVQLLDARTGRRRRTLSPRRGWLQLAEIFQDPASGRLARTSIRRRLRSLR